MDTDSAIYSTSSELLEECLKPGVDPAELDLVMVDPDSALHQGGKLKLESTHTAGLFRSPKCYYLAGSVEVKRMRGVQRKVQAHLEKKHFGQDVLGNTAVTRSVSLRPTRGFQMTLQGEDKSLSHSLNFKRAANVSGLAGRSSLHVHSLISCRRW